MTNNAQLSLEIASASQGKFKNWKYKEFWHPLIMQMEKKGITINEDTSSALILINHNRKEYFKYRKKNPDNIVFLIRTEPISVYPLQYQKKIEDLYDYIITPGGVSNLYKNFNQRNYPYFYQDNPFKFSEENNKLSEIITNRNKFNFYGFSSWNKRQILCSIVASNKLSPIENSNYDLRRLVYTHISNSKISKFGQFWNFNFAERASIRLGMIKFSLKQGYVFNFLKLMRNFHLNLQNVDSIGNKHLILSNSKFHLIIENSNDFVTEKIFDSFIDGAIPIYIGADLNSLDIPDSCYISCGPDVYALDNVLSELQTLDVKSYLDSISNFICSNDFISNFSGEEIYSQIIDEIIQKIKL